MRVIIHNMQLNDRAAELCAELVGRGEMLGIETARNTVGTEIIDCGVCAIYCPVDAIMDPDGNIVKRIKPRDIPKDVCLLRRLEA